MTKMLAGVNGVKEAEIALAGGADVIDVRQPMADASATGSNDAVHRTVSFVAGRRPVSATGGNLPLDAETIRAGAESIANAGADWIKIGFLSSPEAFCLEALAPLAGRAKLIAVLFADAEPDFGLMSVLARHGFQAVMIDTADKDGGRLLDHMPPARVSDFVGQAKALGLMAGLSGSLEAPDVPRLLPFAPDFLGFRHALLGRSQRPATIDPTALAGIRALIPREGAPDAPHSSAAPFRPDGGASEVLGADKIFVRDFVLPVHIGAYGFEHGRTQKVRFDVTADVTRITGNPEDMRHVVSYDLILDGIRAIVARGHVQLSEALAEHVAAHVLRHPRVTRVLVRVEKLELGAGGVGVEIERRRATEPPAPGPSGTIPQTW